MIRARQRRIFGKMERAIYNNKRAAKIALYRWSDELEMWQDFGIAANEAELVGPLAHSAGKQGESKWMIVGEYGGLYETSEDLFDLFRKIL